jgi:amino acid transporter
MRLAVIWGGIGSIVLTAALLLAIPGDGSKGVQDTVGDPAGAVPHILAQLPSGVQDFLLLMIIFAFFSCGTSIQGAGSRLAFSYARDEALPMSSWISRVHHRFGTPVNALVGGAVVSAAFVLLVFASPAEDKHFLFITYPGGVNALVALVSFGVSGIYLSFLLTVIAAFIARRRGWVPEGRFTLGRWGELVTWIAMLYLGLMLINVVLPTGLSSPRAFFNLDWITLLVMFVIAVIGAAYFFAVRPDRGVRHHLHDELEPSGEERELSD